jgi:hypothetical protein
MKAKPLPGLACIIVLPLYILLASRAFAAVTFLDDWADFGSQFRTTGPEIRFLDGQRVEWVAGYGANHWRIVTARGDDRLQVEHDPTSPKQGTVLRVEVRPGDWVGHTGERAEVSDMLRNSAHYWVTGASGHEVYGISIKLDPNWQPPLHDSTHQNTWGLFMQLHSPNAFDSPPSIALAADTQFRVQTLAGDLMGVDGKRRDGSYLPFTNGDLRPGHWVQFLVDVAWAYDTMGSLTIYRRDEGESGFTAVLTEPSRPTLQFDSHFPNSQNSDPAYGPTYVHYWKAGYYRNISPGVTSRLWLGPIVRGSTLQEVAIAAFGRR